MCAIVEGFSVFDPASLTEEQKEQHRRHTTANIVAVPDHFRQDLKVLDQCLRSAGVRDSQEPTYKSLQLDDNVETIRQQATLRVTQKDEGYTIVVPPHVDFPPSSMAIAVVPDGGWVMPNANDGSNATF